MTNDDAYTNGAYIPDGAGYPARWAAKAAAFREIIGAEMRQGLDYGPGGRNRLDLFLPKATPRGMMVFVHGGYWQAFDRSDWSHLSAGALARGWAVAIPSYTLCPEARIFQITAEISAAIGFAAGLVVGPIALTGHSAGGHLVARMACAGVLPDAIARRVSRVVPISPVSDLRPLLQTNMNATLRLDMAEAMAESPALLVPRSDIPLHVWVGADERPAFFDQARWLGTAWGCPVMVEPQRHHFDVIEGLEDENSLLMRVLFGQDATTTPF